VSVPACVLKTEAHAPPTTHLAGPTSEPWWGDWQPATIGRDDASELVAVGRAILWGNAQSKHGAAAAKARSYLHAMGLTDHDIRRRRLGLNPGAAPTTTPVGLIVPTLDEADEVVCVAIWDREAGESVAVLVVDRTT
jgi:hypothetical protein